MTRTGSDDHPSALRDWFWAISQPVLPDVASSVDREQHLRNIRDAFDGIVVIVGDRSPQEADSKIESLTYDLGLLLWDTDLPERDRVEAVAAAGRLFATYFPGRARSAASEMFWDITISRTWKAEPANAAIGEAIFRQLQAQLESSDETVLYSALHGLGHLEDSRAQPLIDRFIERCTDRELVEYARRARDFKVV